MQDEDLNKYMKWGFFYACSKIVQCLVGYLTLQQQYQRTWLQMSRWNDEIAKHSQGYEEIVAIIKSPPQNLPRKYVLIAFGSKYCQSNRWFRCITIFHRSLMLRTLIRIKVLDPTDLFTAFKLQNRILDFLNYIKFSDLRFVRLWHCERACRGTNISQFSCLEICRWKNSTYVHIYFGSIDRRILTLEDDTYPLAGYHFVCQLLFLFVDSRTWME